MSGDTQLVTAPFAFVAAGRCWQSDISQRQAGEGGLGWHLCCYSLQSSGCLFLKAGAVSCTGRLSEGTQTEQAHIPAGAARLRWCGYK